MKTDLSIIISTYNRSGVLRNALESLKRLSSDGLFTYQIIVVDNNSKDNTKQVVEAFRDSSHIEVKYFFEPNQGISYARNRGIKESEGEFLVFTDDDCLPDAGWLKEIYQCFKATGCDAIGGRIFPGFPQNTPQWVKQCLEVLRGPVVFHDYGEEIKPYVKPMIQFFGANMAFRREAFQEIGFFRVDLGVGQGTMGDETEFFNRLEKNRRKIVYCGKAVVWHPVEPERLTLKYLAKWYIGLGKYRFLIDEQEAVDDTLPRNFGIPRYLLRETLCHGFRLIGFSIDRRKFLMEWRTLMVKVGRAIAMRDKFLKEKRT